jgi:putative restriction endonuclease|tara:strand:+ start:658 stop:852 length:195 start_codon:yes stop_codon:yes gene_type:complete
MLPFGRLSETTPEIKALEAQMEMTPWYVSMKLCNFASLDPVIYEFGRKGLSNVSKKIDKFGLGT